MPMCPQGYLGTEMFASPCDRCSVGWNAKRNRCTVPSGAEHFPRVPTEEIPSCPLQDQCQHQLQSTSPCAVRSRGLICESALVFGGMDPIEAGRHPLGFNAMVCASPEEWHKILEQEAAQGLTETPIGG